MYYKCDLLIGGYSYPVTDYIMNWDDMTVSFKRGDYDGIVRTFTDKFEFVKGARTLLLNEYRTNYLKAGANIVISTRNNSWTWTERFRCALDFSTLSDNGYVVSINAVDDSVAALIKAKKGTEYEYSVSEMADSVKLHYDRMLMKGHGEWIYTGESTVRDGEDVYENNFAVQGDTTIPLYLSATPEIPVRNSAEMKDVDKFEIDFDSLGYVSYPYGTPSLFTLLKPMNISNLDLVTARYTSSIKLYAELNGQGTCTIALTNGTWMSTEHVIWSKSISNGLNDLSFEIDDYLTGLLDRNLYLVIQLRDGATCKLWHSQSGSSEQKVTVEYYDRGEPVNLDVIKPVALLNKLLKSMNGGADGLDGVIVASGEKRLDNAMLLAAESARQMPNAKVYSSFDKFSKWMNSVFGYVYDINGKTVTFRPRKDYFGSEVVKTITDFTGYTMNVNPSLIYSQVNIGYEKQDYDSVNGKDEFRFTNIYNTGLTLTDNKLELISPYRADAYGIEFLAQKIGEDTTDDSSDTDLFFVCAASDGTQYILDRSDVVAGVISPVTMFNAAYSPTSMIEANKAFLGGFISELGYASSEGNTAVTINGKAENRDITIDGGMFLAEEVEVETSDIELPEDMTGIVEFEYQGETVQGYYKSTDFTYTKTKSAKITLIRKK